MNPRYAGTLRSLHGKMSYTDYRFDNQGNFCVTNNPTLKLIVDPYLGRDADGMLKYPTSATSGARTRRRVT